MSTNILEPRTDNKLLTAADVCERLQVCKSTLDKLVAEGQFPPGLRVANKLRRWAESSVNAWIDSKANEGA
jgi:predicted DNA-binding transcriptional regulator AlpA